MSTTVYSSFTSDLTTTQIESVGYLLKGSSVAFNNKTTIDMTYNFINFVIT